MLVLEGLYVCDFVDQSPGPLAYSVQHNNVGDQGYAYTIAGKYRNLGKWMVVLGFSV